MAFADFIADIDNAIAMYERGALSQEVADVYDIPYSSVLNHLRKRGVKIRPRGHGIDGPTKRKLSRSQDAEVASRYEAGEKLAELGRDYGVSQGTIRLALKRENVTPRPGHKIRTKDRFVTSGGYIQVRLEADDPLGAMRTADNIVLEHRLVMARAVGRPLTAQETVHHINGDRGDNRLENLELRQGKHGAGVCLKCADCGSLNVQPVGLS